MDTRSLYYLAMAGGCLVAMMLGYRAPRLWLVAVLLAVVGVILEDGVLDPLAREASLSDQHGYDKLLVPVSRWFFHGFFLAIVPVSVALLLARFRKAPTSAAKEGLHTRPD